MLTVCVISANATLNGSSSSMEKFSILTSVIFIVSSCIDKIKIIAGAFALDVL